LKTRFELDHSNQEDWGWFIWLRKGRIKLGVEITCEDREKGRYRLELWSKQSVFLWWDRAADTPELEALREDVQKRLSSWLGSTPPVKRV